MNLFNNEILDDYGDVGKKGFKLKGQFDCEPVLVESSFWNQYMNCDLAELLQNIRVKALP